MKIEPVKQSATILSGRPIRAERAARLIQAVKGLSYTPKLAIIQIGDRPDSTTYIHAKRSFAEQIGVKTELVHFLENISQEEIIAQIKNFNTDSSIQGIIVQLPLPAHLNRDEIVNTVDPSKDVDGLTAINQEKLLNNNPSAIVPATARGVKELLDYYHVDLKDKKVVVVGRSLLVGTPIARVCMNNGATVTICHSKTEHIPEKTKEADILIVAAGRPGLIGAGYVNDGQIVIDVGINRMLDGHLKGDVDHDAIKDIVSAITPVPGGVGQMTVVALFENLLDACK